MAEGEVTRTMPDRGKVNQGKKVNNDLPMAIGGGNSQLLFVVGPGLASFFALFFSCFESCLITLVYSHFHRLSSDVVLMILG